MINIEELSEKLKRLGYMPSYFATGEEAAEYLKNNIKNTTVGFGDSQTLNSMDLYRLLSEGNTVYDPNQSKDNDEFLSLAKEALTTEVFVTGVNAMTKNGEMINIDGTGNRVAGSLFGHKRVYFVLGVNKITDNIDNALWHIRNVSAPLNAKRLGYKTPCAVKGDKCYNCNSPQRICNAVVVYLRKMMDIDHVEIIIIGESLGL